MTIQFRTADDARRAHSNLAAVTFRDSVEPGSPGDGQCAFRPFDELTSYPAARTRTSRYFPLALNMSRGAVHVGRVLAADDNTGVSTDAAVLRYGAIKCVSRLAEGQVCRRSRGR